MTSRDPERSILVTPMSRTRYLEIGWIWKLRSKVPPIGNGQWGIEWSLVTWVTDVVTWPRKVKLVTPICLERNMSKTAGNAIWQVGNYKTVGCEAVWSAILATAWLLVQFIRTKFTALFCIILPSRNFKKR